MKQTLTVLCLMIALAGAGQRWGGMMEADTIAVGKMDTIAIIMLVCDTAQKERWIGGDDSLVRTYEIVNMGNVYWIRGYQVNVRKKWVDEPGTMCWHCPNYWQFVGYLDRQKNPIRKSMIIFNVKNIQ